MLLILPLRCRKTNKKIEIEEEKEKEKEKLKYDRVNFIANSPN